MAYCSIAKTGVFRRRSCVGGWRSEAACCEIYGDEEDTIAIKVVPHQIYENQEGATGLLVKRCLTRTRR